MRIIKLEPLTKFAFAKFGDVLDAAEANPQINFSVNILNSLDGARTNVSLIKAPILKLPSKITLLQRHPLSWQSYFPLGSTDYVIIVAHSGPYGAPDLDTLVGFSVPAGIGISYHPKTWHAAASSLTTPGHFVMIIEEFGTFEDQISLQIDPFKVIE